MQAYMGPLLLSEKCINMRRLEYKLFCENAHVIISQKERRIALNLLKGTIINQIANKCRYHDVL